MASDERPNAHMRGQGQGSLREEEASDDDDDDDDDGGQRGAVCGTPGCRLRDFHAGPCTSQVVGPRPNPTPNPNPGPNPDPDPNLI